MRILLGAATFYPDENGVSTFLQHLAPALKERGHEVLIICPSTTRKDEEREFKGVPVFAPRSVPFPINMQFRLCVSPVLQRVIKAKVEEFQPDVIHVQDPFTIALALTYTAKRKGIPLVGTHHTDIAMYQEYFPMIPDAIQDRVAAVEWSMLCWFLSQLDAITSPTKAAAQPLYDHGLKKEVRTISNGIDLEHFSVTSNPDLRQQYGIDADEQVILSVGRLDPEKNVDLIITAFANAEVPTKTRLMIVGTGKTEKKLKRLAEKLGVQDRVIFVGRVEHSDLPGYYNVANVFVAAGHAETQSLVTLEAMASGLPVIAANALALPELVTDGENGYTFEPGNATALQVALEKMIASADDRQAFGKASRKRAEAHDKTHTYEAFEELYASLLR